MIWINIGANAYHCVGDHDLNHRRGCRRDFDESESLLMEFALDDTSLHPLRRRPNSCAGEIQACRAMAETLAPGFRVSSMRVVLAYADQRRSGLTSRRLGVVYSIWKPLSSGTSADIETDTESFLL